MVSTVQYVLTVHSETAGGDKGKATLHMWAWHLWQERQASHHRPRAYGAILPNSPEITLSPPGSFVSGERLFTDKGGTFNSSDGEISARTRTERASSISSSRPFFSFFIPPPPLLHPRLDAS